MVIQTVIDVRILNVGQNVERACLIVKLIDLMFVVILASKTVVGNQVYTQEFIEISEQ